MYSAAEAKIRLTQSKCQTPRCLPMHVFNALQGCHLSFVVIGEVGGGVNLENSQ